MGGLSVGDEAPEYLCDELFEGREVKALLVDVEENIEVQMKEEYTCWMNPSKAIDLVEGVDLGEVIGMMQGSFLVL